MPDQETTPRHLRLVFDLLSVLNQKILSFWIVCSNDVNLVRHSRCFDRVVSVTIDLNRIEKSTSHARPGSHVVGVRLPSVPSKRITHNVVITSTLPKPGAIIEIGNSPGMNQFVRHNTNGCWFVATDILRGRRHHVRFDSVSSFGDPFVAKVTDSVRPNALFKISFVVTVLAANFRWVSRMKKLFEAEEREINRTSEKTSTPIPPSRYVPQDCQ